MKGGHNKPCSLSPKTNRCASSDVGDASCINDNGRCKRVISKPQKSPSKQSSPKQSPKQSPHKQSPTQSPMISLPFGCVKRTEKKYSNRKSPPYSAQDCPNVYMRGGPPEYNLYVSQANKNGIFTWKVVKNVPHSPKQGNKSPQKPHSPKQAPQKPQKPQSPNQGNKPSSKPNQQLKWTPDDGVMVYQEIRPREYLSKPDHFKFLSSGDYYASVKSDGWQCIWDGNSQLFTKTGKNNFSPPSGWINALPKDVPIAGELIIPGKQATSVASLKNTSSDWSIAELRAFDIPDNHLQMPFEERTKLLKALIDESCKKASNNNKQFICPVKYIPQIKITSEKQLLDLYNRVIHDGEEGLVLTHKNSMYNPGIRTKHRMKLKGRNDVEGKVVDFNLNGGKLKSLVIELDAQMLRENFGISTTNNIRFNLGIGFSNAQRNNYQNEFKLGDIVKFSYRSFTDNGKPKEARFVEVRTDMYGGYVPFENIIFVLC